MEKKVNHLRDEIRRTFTIYALVPIFIMSLISFGLAVGYWNLNVVERNEQCLAKVGGSLEQLLRTCMNDVDALANSCDVARLGNDGAYKVQMYRQFYALLNQSEAYTDFYVLDAGQSVVASSRSQEPGFSLLTWGIIKQMQEKPQAITYTFISDVKNFSQPMDIAIGKAIMKDGKIQGYLVFIISGSTILNGISNPYVHIVVKDSFDYTPICTDHMFCNEWNKMQDKYKNLDGYISFADAKFYVSKQRILDGELTVYAFTSIGQMVAQFTYAIFILFGVLLILTITVIVSVKRQAAEKTEMIDQLVEAFEAVQAGILDKEVQINTNNEFEIIGKSYNMMRSSLNNLMQTNKEQARETVISEIKQLESQFNPHFLFNTLENIKFMIKLDPNAAGKMIVALSGLLRYSINNSVNRVKLKEDMQYIQYYLDIQKYRFGNRLNYILSVPKLVQDCIVPKLIMQPIVENAIKYGMKNCQHLVVEIEVSLEDGRLVIHVGNSGAGLDSEELAEIQHLLTSKKGHSEHSGLYNINRRIQLMYGEGYGVTITSEMAIGTMVSIVIPYEKAGEDVAQGIDC